MKDLKGQKHKIFSMPFARVYPLYITKVEKKNRTKQEVDQIIFWLTGHDAVSLKKVLDDNVDFETFYANCPNFNPDASKIKGLICGVRVEDIEDITMRRLRYLDKLIDELAKGKSMDKILNK
jgi:hypothetical protein